ncbi:MAG: type I-B CRISPR-associated protein Cas7/Cst2/DevR [Sulfurihydrogenibium sp.]|uniref:type I-B CRISPR-associated protein Cas7/Cst2/DevR n=1 Tax=Sulfurihydrogenibium sp. TaxID=2053621 RepID=UPI003D132CF0
MKLTGVFVIETGVVNRGDGIGNIATVKKLTTPEGIKVFFSPPSYKRALWKALNKHKNWSLPMVTKEGGVVQRTGTIIDSEEFDFAGTMIVSPKYERECTLLVDNGISINNYYGDMDFMTNMALSKQYGENEANIINKENFYGIYILPFAIEIDRVGIQHIKTVDTKIEDTDDLETKIKKIYKALKLEEKITDEQVKEWTGILESINYDKKNKTTEIVLTKKERKRRLKDLLEGMGELSRRIEGSERNLSPFFAAFSLTYISPKYLMIIKDFLKKKLSEGGYLDVEELSNEIKDFASKEGKEIMVTDYINYKQVIEEIINKIEIFKE